MLNRSHTKKSLSLNETYWRIFWKKFRRKGQQAENDKTERVTGLGRRTREERAKWNQMTALRFQTGGRHQTSPASLRGSKRGYVLEQLYAYMAKEKVGIKQNTQEANLASFYFVCDYIVLLKWRQCRRLGLRCGTWFVGDLWEKWCCLQGTSPPRLVNFQPQRALTAPNLVARLQEIDEVLFTI